MTPGHPRPIGRLFGGALLALALLVSAYFIVDRVYTTQQMLETDSRTRIEELVSVVDSYWGNEIAHGDTTDIQTSIANLTASGNYRTIALLDQQDRVLAASRLDWMKQPILMLVEDFNTGLARSARESGHHNVHFSADQSLVQAYMPISVHRDKLATQLQSVSLLYVEYDLGPLRREQRQQAALHIGGFMLLLVLLGGALWHMLRRSLQQRLESLMQATRRMASGDLGARTQLSGNDELSELGATFDKMAERLAAERADLLRHQATLAESERKYRMLFDDSRDGIAIFDNDGRYLDANPRYLNMLGYTLDEIRHLGHVDFTPNKWHAIEAQIVENQLYKRGYTDEYEKEYIDRNGRVFPVSIKASLMYGQYGEVTGMWGTARDISERKQAEARLLLAARVFENSGEGIVITNNARIVVSINDAFTRITGYELADVYGQSLQLHGTGLNDQAFLQAMWEALDEVGYWEGEIGYRHRDGNPRHVWLIMRQVRDSNGQLTNYIGHLADISERRAWEEHFRYLSEHDYLTGLPNRTLFQDRLQQAIRLSARQDEMLAVAFMDLDRFKNINDSLGHHIGDRLLHAVAERIRQHLRASDTLSRQGGDEFILLLTGLHRTEDAVQVIEQLQRSVADIYLIDEYEFGVTCSIGVSMFPRDGSDYDSLIKHADAAMYQAKAAGRNSYHFYTHDLSERAVERVQIESGLRRALDNQELQVFYQPQIDIDSGRIVGAEALLRWIHPELGTIPPLRFIPVAEETGLIVPIGEWVLHSACRQACQWQAQGFALSVAVNLSAVQFRHKALEQSIGQALSASGLAPQWLELELTEGLIMDGSDSVIGIMQRLRQIGVKLSVDDFGTGYSSLSYLKRFPLDKLKIDQSFVRDVTTDPDDAAITRAIINMAQSLKLKVIAEGVETQEQLEFLRRYECDEYQGYYCSKPVPADEFLMLLRQASGNLPT